MTTLNQIFSYYDQLIGGLSIHTQALISLAIIIFLIWNIYTFIKSGHWIFIVILILTLPGTWPAAKNILTIVWVLFYGLVLRVQGL